MDQLHPGRHNPGGTNIPLDFELIVRRSTARPRR